MEWQPIQTAPKDGSRLLMLRVPPSIPYPGYQSVVIGRFDDVKGNFKIEAIGQTSRNFREEFFDGWMPLPSR